MKHAVGLYIEQSFGAHFVHLKGLRNISINTLFCFSTRKKGVIRHLLYFSLHLVSKIEGMLPPHSSPQAPNFSEEACCNLPPNVQRHTIQRLLIGGLIPIHGTPSSRKCVCPPLALCLQGRQ